MTIVTTPSSGPIDADLDIARVEQRLRESNRRRSRGILATQLVIVLVALQVFSVTVAVEAFLTDDEGLGWAAAGVSVALFAGAAAFLRYLEP